MNHASASHTRVLCLGAIPCLLAAAAFAGAPQSARHDADTNGDFRIGLGELLRVIQLYNADQYHCDPSTLDDFATGAGDRSCTRHDADYTLPHWRITLSELLRVLQLFAVGTYGCNAACPDCEDGFLPSGTPGANCAESPQEGEPGGETASEGESGPGGEGAGDDPGPEGAGEAGGELVPEGEAPVEAEGVTEGAPSSEGEPAPEGQMPPDGERPGDGEPAPGGEPREGEPTTDGEPAPGGEPIVEGELQPGGEPGAEGEAPGGGEPAPDGEPQAGGEPNLEGEAQPGGEPNLEGEPQPGGEPNLEGEPQPGGEPNLEGEPQPGGEPTAEGEGDALEGEGAEGEPGGEGQGILEGETPEGEVPPAPFPVGTLTTTFEDPNRGGRDIDVTVWYPGESAGEDVPVAAGVFPVIAFGHGFTISVNAYDYLVEGLVPAGYILAFADTESGFLPDHEDFGRDLAFIVDTFQALDQDNASPFFGKVGERSGVSGHSMGGGSTFLSVGFSDNISAIGPLAAAETDPSAIDAAASITIPSLVIAGALDCVSPPEDNQLPMFNNVAADCKNYVSITGGSHCQFAQDSLTCNFGENFVCGGADFVENTVQKGLTVELLVGWFDLHLKQRPGARTLFEQLLASETGAGRITIQGGCPEPVK